MTDSAPPPGSGSASAALRRLGASFAALLRTRGELASIELQEFTELRRQILVATIGAAVLLTFALMMLTLLVVAAFWDTHRFAAIVGLLVLYGGGGVALALRARQLGHSAPKPFAATLEELERDIEQLRKK